MQVGNIFTIEPMINLGTEWKNVSWPDDWTVSTIDGARSAAAEETLLITETGVEVLTAKGGSKGYDTRENRQKKQEQQSRDNEG
jgi:methionyl aminopeptidase